MSPASRRRRKKPISRPGRRRPPATPRVDQVFGEILDGFAGLSPDEDPLDVEMFTSGLLGSWWHSVSPDEEPERTIGLVLVDYAARSRRPEAAWMLRALAALGTTDDLRQAASLAAAATGAAGGAGGAAPAWAAALGAPRVTQCWQLADVYGDQVNLLYVFDRDGREHGVVTLVDLSAGTAWARDTFVVDTPAQVLEHMRKEADSDPVMVLESVSPAEARRLLETGFDTADEAWSPEVPAAFAEHRALAMARVRALPAPAAPPPEPPRVTPRERDALVTEFLGSPEAADLDDPDRARVCAALIVDFGADADGGRPLRVGPRKSEVFMHDWLPARAILDDGQRDAMPAVHLAWVRWAARRTGLSEAATANVVEAAQEIGATFVDTYDDPENTSPVRVYLRDVSPTVGTAALQDILDRRQYAMPFLGTRIGDEEFPWLDPGDEDELRILIEGEHPEYHAALADPSFSGEIDGVSPALHVTMHHIVALHLWHADPPEAWQAAMRLREAGVERHDVLHRLADVAARHVYRVLVGEVGPEELDAHLAAYREALDGLTAP